jgi:hypothetical protein
MSRRELEIHRHPKYPRLVVHQRPRSSFYQARCSIDGKPFTHSCGTPEFTTALKIAGDWYKSLLRDQQARHGRHPSKEIDPILSEKFLDYRNTLSKTAKKYAQWRWDAISAFWGRRSIRSITSSTFHEFYKLRRRNKISNHTLHKDVTVIRQILKYCAETELLSSLPIIPRVGKIDHTPRKWLDRVQWELLHKTSRYRIDEAEDRPRLRRVRQDCHDFAIFMLNSMLRVDELRNLTFGDCRIVKTAKQEEVLELNVRVSKTGPRSGVLCTVPATLVFKRRLGDHGPSDKIFPRSCGREFQRLLIHANLYEDGDNRRNLKSLRATSISFRILEGADVTIVAKNAGTSINSINNFYAKYLRGADAIEQMTRLTDEYMLREVEKHQDRIDKFREIDAAQLLEKTGDQKTDAARRRKTLRILKKYTDKDNRRRADFAELRQRRRAEKKKVLPS